MPLFDFKCHNCSTISEILTKSTTTVKCPECGSESVEKLISTPRESGIVLKGDGFYKPSKSSW